MGAANTSSFNEQEYNDFARKKNEILRGKDHSSWPEPYGTMFTVTLKTHTSSSKITSSSSSPKSSTMTSLQQNNTSFTTSSTTASTTATITTEQERRQAVAALRIFSRVAHKQNDIFNQLIQKISNNDHSITSIVGPTDLHKLSKSSGKNQIDSRRNNVWCSDRLFILAAAMRNAQDAEAGANTGTLPRGPARIKLRSLDFSNCNDLDRSYTETSDYFVNHHEYLEILQKVTVELQHGVRINETIFGSIETARVPKNTVNIMYDSGKVSYGVPSMYVPTSLLQSTQKNTNNQLWNQCVVGQAYYGDRGITPESWSTHLQQPILISSLDPALCIVKQIDVCIRTDYGCPILPTDSAKDLLANFPFWKLVAGDDGDDGGDGGDGGGGGGDAVKDDWIVLPVTCNDRHQEQNSNDVEPTKVNYTITLLRLAEPTTMFTQERQALEADMLNQITAGKNLTKADAELKKYEQYVKDETSEPRRVIVELDIVRNSDATAAAASSTLLPTNEEGYAMHEDCNKAKSELYCSLHGLSLHGMKVGTRKKHHLVNVSTDNQVITELPTTILTQDYIGTSGSNTVRGRNVFNRLKKALTRTMETRQTRILATSMKTKKLNDLYCIPSGLGNAAELGGNVCRIACCETTTATSITSTESGTNSTHTHTLAFEDGAVEYGVPRSHVQMTSDMTKGERAYLNVVGKNIQLTLEGRLPYNSKYDSLSIYTQDGKIIPLTRGDETKKHNGGLMTSNHMLEKGTLHLTSQNVEDILRQGCETGVVRVMSSLHVGDRVKTAESPNMYHRGVISAINDNTYVLRTSSGEERGQVQRSNVFLKRDMEMKLAQWSALMNVTSHSGGTTVPGLYYPTEPMQEYASVLVRVNVQTLRPDSAGTVLLVDTVSKYKREEETGQYIYTTRGYGQETWLRRGCELNANHALPDPEVLKQHGIPQLIVSTLKFGHNTEASLANNCASDALMSVRFDMKNGEVTTTNSGDDVEKLSGGIYRCALPTLRSGMSVQQVLSSAAKGVTSVTSHHGTYGVRLPTFARLVRSVPQNENLPWDGKEETKKISYLYDIATEEGEIIRGQQRYRFWVNVPPQNYPTMTPGQVVLYRPGGISDIYFYGVVNDWPLKTEHDAKENHDADNDGNSLVPICLIRTGTNSTLLSYLKVHAQQLSTETFDSTERDYVMSGGSTKTIFSVKRSYLQPMSNNEHFTAGLEIKRTKCLGPTTWINPSLVQPMDDNAEVIVAHTSCSSSANTLNYDITLLNEKCELLRRCSTKDLIVARPGLRVAVYPSGWEWSSTVHSPSCVAMDETDLNSTVEERPADLTHVKNPTLTHGILIRTKTSQENEALNAYHADIFPEEGGFERCYGATCDIELDNPCGSVGLKLLVVHASFSTTTAEEETKKNPMMNIATTFESGEGNYVGMEELLGWVSRTSLPITKVKVVSLVTMESEMRKIEQQLIPLEEQLKTIQTNEKKMRQQLEKNRLTLKQLQQRSSTSSTAKRKDEDKNKDSQDLPVLVRTVQEENELVISLEEKRISLYQQIQEYKKELTSWNFEQYNGCVYLSTSRGSQPKKKLQAHGYTSDILTMIVSESSTVSNAASSTTSSTDSTNTANTTNENMTTFTLEDDDDDDDDDDDEANKDETTANNLKSTMKIPALRVDKRTNRTEEGGDGSPLYECVVESTLPCECTI